MMQETPVSRRAVLAGGAGLCAGLAGCISTSATPPGSGDGTDSAGGSDGDMPVLRSGGSSTVYPIVDTAADYWMTNEAYWHPNVQYGIQTDEHLADYWASLYGFGPTDGDTPPFGVSVSLSHSGTGLKKLRNGRLDIGNSSAPVSAEFPDWSKEVLSNYTNHVVGVDAQPIVVSEAIYKHGVKKITAETLKAIYKGKITNWTEVPGYTGPPKKIQAVGRAEGSGTDTAFRNNLYGNPNAPIPGVDVRKGQNQQVKKIVKKSDNAIAYMALAFVDESVPAITLVFNGTKYVPGKNLAEGGYPLARDLHCYTWKGTSRMEAAFLRMIISDFGQQNFVSAVGYSSLTDEQQRKQLEKLPDPHR